MSCDPIGAEGSGLNMYWFNSGNPVSRVDLNGMKDMAHGFTKNNGIVADNAFDSGISQTEHRAQMSKISAMKDYEAHKGNAPTSYPGFYEGTLRPIIDTDNGSFNGWTLGKESDVQWSFDKNGKFLNAHEEGLEQVIPLDPAELFLMVNPKDLIKGGAKFLGKASKKLNNIPAGMSVKKVDNAGDGLKLIDNTMGVEGGNLLDKNINFSVTAAKHMDNPNRYIPVQLMKDVIENSKSIPDPRGSNALMYYDVFYRTNKKYNIEVLYDKPSNTIYHFEYHRKEIGSLKSIKKGEK
jgi:hypothetical protein